MGRSACCDKSKVKRGTWSPQEDALLKNYLHNHGTAGNWIALPNKAGLNRCGKSCRLRWLNYLRPDIKRGGFTQHEESTICTLYNKLGSRWSVIASHLRGRTDNDVKNYWNTKLKKKFMATKSYAETAVPADAIETTGAATSQAVPLALQDYSPRAPYRPESATNEPINFGSVEESSDCSNGGNEMNLPFCPTYLEQDPSPFGSFCLGMDGSNEVMDEYSREIEWNLDDPTYINNIYNPLAN